MEDTSAYKEYMRIYVEHFYRLVSLVSPLIVISSSGVQPSLCKGSRVANVKTYDGRRSWSAVRNS